MDNFNIDGSIKLRNYSDKLIHHYHGLPLPIYKNKYTFRHWLNEKLMMNRYYKVVAISNYMANEIKVKFVRTADVLPNAIDLAKFKPNKPRSFGMYLDKNWYSLELKKKP